MEELKGLLKDVPDAYSDFIVAMTEYAAYSAERQERLHAFLIGHPGARTADIIGYVSDQPDFYDDAAEDDVEMVVA